MTSFKPGDRVSVWHRNSSRHKWRMHMSDVRLLRIESERVVVQTGLEDETTGPTIFALHGFGAWQRELRTPVLFPISEPRSRFDQ